MIRAQITTTAKPARPLGHWSLRRARRAALRSFSVSAAFFTFLLAALAVTGALLQPAPLHAALAAFTLWSAAVALHAAFDKKTLRLRPAILPLGALAALYFLLLTLATIPASPLPPALFSILYPLPILPASAAIQSALLPLLIVSAFAGFFLQTYTGLRARNFTTASWTAPLTAALLKFHTLVFAFTTALLFAEKNFSQPLQPVWAAVLAVSTLAWLLETGLRQIGRLYTPARFLAASPPATLGWVLAPFLTREQRQRWRAPADADTPVVALADMWFLPTLRRLALPLLILAGLLAWGSTAFHEIPHGHVGLHSRFGRMAADTLSAGLHVTLPFPLHEVNVLPRDRLQRVVLGLETDTGKPILWDRDHYVGEASHLVGRGEELLTISVPIYFHIADPVAHFRHTVDSAAVIRDLAYQELLAETMQRSAFAIMTSDRDALAESLRRKLQSALNRRQTGLVVDLVCLRDIHPPVQVGPAYQEVVSALEEREAFTHEGETYRAENLPRARSDSARLRAEANTSRATRVARATGESHRFTALLASYSASPDVFRIRETYAAFDQSLRGVKKLLVDDTFRGRLPTFIDIRKTLNPDFAPPIQPENPSLIPTLSEKLSDYDRTVEGYLQMGQGAIPAVSPHAEDPDNLLGPKSP
jgi:regulator of protease activity HflC (stomatin/prohibitin superfamily)